MKISNTLLNSYHEQLESSFRHLQQQIQFLDHEEIFELKTSIQKNLHVLQALKSLVLQLETTHQPVNTSQIFSDYKKMKLELRFARRSWERFLSNQERIRKIHERRAHVATVAA